MHNIQNLLGLSFEILPQQIVNGVLIGGIYALIALGYTMVYGVLKLINFAHGEVFMLGGFISLFVSWQMGYAPADTPTGPSVMALAVMLLASMVICALIGVIIERFAYRPLRKQPRIASLITAIGVSLLIQYAGQIFLPTSPVPSINSRVSPFQDNAVVTLKSAPAQFSEPLANLKTTFAAAESKWKEIEAKEPDKFNLSPSGVAARDEFRKVETEFKKAEAAVNANSVTVGIPKGQLIMFGTTMMLMAILYFLVMRTKAGRAMRAVSLDFQSASLMGINVDSVITLTFVIGSALAGAGAMMNFTFIGGSSITTFSGVVLGTKAFVAAVLGGIGNIPGAVLGGFLMGVAESLVTWLGYSGYKDAAAFVILIIVLIFKPGGLLGSAAVEKV